MIITSNIFRLENKKLGVIDTVYDIDDKVDCSCSIGSPDGKLGYFVEWLDSFVVLLDSFVVLLVIEVGSSPAAAPPGVVATS